MVIIAAVAAGSIPWVSGVMAGKAKHESAAALAAVQAATFSSQDLARAIEVVNRDRYLDGAKSARSAAVLQNKLEVAIPTLRGKSATFTSLQREGDRIRQGADRMAADGRVSVRAVSVSVKRDEMVDGFRVVTLHISHDLGGGTLSESVSPYVVTDGSRGLPVGAFYAIDSMTEVTHPVPDVIADSDAGAGARH